MRIFDRQTTSSPNLPDAPFTPHSATRNLGELPPTDELTELRARVAELERERDHLIAVVGILHDVSGTLHFTDILQAIARKLAQTFGLERCSIYLSGDAQGVRLMATFEDPSMQNVIVDLERYPELKHAFAKGETVFIPDASTDPRLEQAQAALAERNVRSIIVVPIRSNGTTIGAIFLRTDRDAEPFSDRDIRFCQVVASLTATALRNAHRFESLLRSQQDQQRTQRKTELERIALVAFVRRLLDRYTHSEDHMWAESLLPTSADEELERLVSVAIAVVEREAAG
jgi:GAF domain-containing protein